MRHALRALCLLSLVVLMQSCSRGDKPSENLTSPTPSFSGDESVGFLNECPVAVTLAVSVDQDGSVNFQLVGSDADGDVLQYLVVQPPLHGSVTVSTQTGAATYNPVPGYCGPESFTFKVMDGSCDSPAAAVLITVNCPPPPDEDGDGVPDALDLCPQSDLRGNLWVGECDTGVPNLIDDAIVNDDGCSLADLVGPLLADAAAGADNPGQVVTGAMRSLQILVSDGLISRMQVGAIVRCVGRSVLPQ